MSVLVDYMDGNLSAYVKGAPEVILEICLKETIPTNVKEQLLTLTERGYRVIACAYKRMAVDEATERSHLESGLIFLGFIVLENRVKARTPMVLKTLNASGFFCIMSTGK
jgi:cation-transporting ATPase 13A2